jgi:hypothetical protein
MINGSMLAQEAVALGDNQRQASSMMINIEPLATVVDIRRHSIPPGPGLKRARS